MSLLYEPWIHLKVAFDGRNSFGQVFFHFLSYLDAYLEILHGLYIM